MKIVTEPTVVPIARTVYLGNPNFPIPLDGTDAEKTGAYAAKRCYRSKGVDGRSNVENQRQVMSNLHGSVLEHSYVSFDISGITRACSLELNRHRGLSISQESTRYVSLEEGEGSIVLEPYIAMLATKLGFDRFGSTAANVEVHDDVEERELELVHGHIAAARYALSAYNDQVGLIMRLNPNNLFGTELRKWARGKARNVLPHGLETAGVWTGNHRTWRWFIELRSERHAEPEIRRLAGKLYEALCVIAPTYYEDFTGTVVDGIYEYTPEHHKV